MTTGTGSVDLLGGSPGLHARIAGLVGLLTLASGSFAGFAASRLLVRDDVAATTANLVASEGLFRAGVAGGLLMMVAFLFYGLLLYRLLRPVDANLARTMLALVVASVPLYMLNQVHQYGAFLSASGGLERQVELFLDVFRFGNLVAGIFFGLWLFPLGLLVYRSGFFPRVLGGALVVGTLGYLVLFVQSFLLPGGEGTLWSHPLLWVTHLAELAFMLWLLVRGPDVERWEARTRRAAAR